MINDLYHVATQDTNLPDNTIYIMIKRIIPENPPYTRTQHHMSTPTNIEYTKTSIISDSTTVPNNNLALDAHRINTVICISLIIEQNDRQLCSNIWGTTGVNQTQYSIQNEKSNTLTNHNDTCTHTTCKHIYLDDICNRHNISKADDNKSYTATYNTVSQITVKCVRW